MQVEQECFWICYSNNDRIEAYILSFSNVNAPVFQMETEEKREKCDMFDIIIQIFFGLFRSDDSDQREFAGCITMVIVVILIIALVFGGIYALTKLL